MDKPTNMNIHIMFDRYNDQKDKKIVDINVGSLDSFITQLDE